MREHYGMLLGTKCYFYMVSLFDRHTYFNYKHRDDSSTTDGEYHDPRDSDGIVVPYRPAESEAEDPPPGV
jgi:hypothetical protein